MNKLDREGIEVRLKRITDPNLVDRTITEYGTLETAGWKAKKGTAVNIEDHQGKFYRDLLKNFCSANKGRIYKLLYNDKLVAMDICIEDSKRIIILKTTFDESIKKTSPSILMKKLYFRDIFSERKVNDIEFYGRLMDWHKRFTGEIRQLYHVNVDVSPIVSYIRKRRNKKAS